MSLSEPVAQGLHQGNAVLVAGEPLESARAVVLMVHGRGAQAEDILSLVPFISQPGFAYLAPQASGNTWYPNSFRAPIAENEPWLSSALDLLAEVHARILQNNIPSERTMFLGFSQGACLALEYTARNPRRYGGVVGLSGALIGPDDSVREDNGSFEDTPVFLGCSDVDFHVPKERVDQAAAALKKIGASVTERIYPQMGHTTNEDELAFIRDMMKRLLESQ
jgi:phospholipase/carboxylesterase